MTSSNEYESYEAFDVSIDDDGVATVCLKGPGKGNAMGPAAWRESAILFRELDRDERVRVVVIRGAGKVFTYGLDLMAMAGELGPLLAPGASAKDRATLKDVITSMQGAISALAHCRRPVVAAVHGWCIGAGVDLISAADIRVCSSTAKFSVREVKVAMVADVGSLQRLPHIIGDGATRELALTGRDIDAARARSIGLVSEVFDDDDTLFVGAHALALMVAKNPPLVVQGVKRVMNARIDAEIETGLRTVATHNAAFLASEDLAEAFAAFAERREPVFKGR